MGATEIIKSGVIYQVREKGAESEKYSKPIFDSLILKDGKLVANTPFGTSFWLIACFVEGESTCEWSFNLKERHTESTSKFTGLKSLPEIYNGKFDQIPSFATSKTTIIESTLTTIVVKVEQFIFGQPAGQAVIELVRVSEFQNTTISIDGAYDDLSRRLKYSEVSEAERNLSNSVAQVVIDDVENEDSIGAGNLESKGTGFFLSNEGHFITNLHVAEGIPNCLKKHVCELSLRIVENGSVKKFKAKGILLASSKEHDFSFFKLAIPSDLKIKPLIIERSTIGPELLTFGYPGDRLSDDSNEIDITYSRGKLVGFHGRALQSTSYISGGASGSPLLNVDHRIIGILSNGIGIERKAGDGLPGIARPILTIDHEFGISKYLDGSKLISIDLIVAKLKEATTKNEAEELLLSLEKERSLYGLKKLKEVLVEQSSTEVRRSIFVYLERIGFIPGPSVAE